MNFNLRIWIFMFYIAFGLMDSSSVYSQCDEKLLEQIIEKSGNDALFIREFVYNPQLQNKKKKKDISIFSKFDIRAKEGIVYRFIVADDSNSSARAFLQLRKNNSLLASTFDPETKANTGSFDFLCEETSQYELILSFVDGNEGCAAAAMFALIKDSLSLTAIVDSSEIQNVLYTGMDNFIDIAASDIPGGSLDVSISRGSIDKEGGLYKIRVDEPGKVIVSVQAKDKSGKITETFKTEFLVSEPILPSVSLGRSTGGIIRKNDLLNLNTRLEIHNYRTDLNFKIKSFELTKRLSVPGIVNVSDNSLNYRQLNLIKELEPGDTFYITKIEIEDSKGKTYTLASMGFIIGE